jgi:hypothetical protein
MAVYLQTNFVLPTANHARIGYANYGRTGTWTASSQESVDFAVSALNNEMTLRRWRAATADTTPELDCNFGSAQAISYVGIAAHNLAGKLVTLSYYYDAEESWEVLKAFTPADNEAIMVLFAAVTTQYIKIGVAGTCEIGVVYAGPVLAMARPFYAGHSPAKLSRNTTVLPRQSESGQFLSRTITRRGYVGQYSWRHLSAAWYRANFDPFVAAATERPFFLAWNPGGASADVVYGWTNDDIKPANMGIRDYMEVGFSMGCFRE